METFKDLFGYISKSRKYWLFPAIIVLLLLGAVIIFSGGSAVAPFIYTIF